MCGYTLKTKGEVMGSQRMIDSKGNGTGSQTITKLGPNDGKRPKTFFKKMPELERGKGTWGGGVSRP